MANQWWLRTQDETFGPETRDRLLEWARMGRIQPGQEISEDGETWRPATEVPFLDMRWSIDIGDGTPRGPFNKQAAQTLLASGRLPKGSKLVEVAPPMREEPVAEASPAQSPVSAPATVAGPAPVAPTPAPERESLISERELAALRGQVEKLRVGMQAAERRAAEAEKTVADARAEAKGAVKAADLAEARCAEAQKAQTALEARLVDAQRNVEKKDAELARLRAAFNQQQTDAEKELAARDSALAEKDTALAARDSALAEKDTALAARDDQLQLLSDEIKRLPPTAQLAADAQAAIYALMQEEAAELTAALEVENREAEQLREYRRARTERLLARRQEILRHIGSDAADMTRRALLAHPEDPRTVHLRQELEALRVLQERAAQEAERKIRDLTEKLRVSTGEADFLRQKTADVTVLYRQLQDARERLQRRERELAEERKRAEEMNLQYTTERQALLARLSALELGMPGSTHQSREARSVKLAPWMGLRQ